MKTAHKTINLETAQCFDFIDITNIVKNFVKKSKIVNGLVNIQSKHTTCAIIINEKEPLLLRDIKRRLEKLVPQSELYEHDDFKIRTVNMCEGECANGHSHCKAILMPSNTCVNLINHDLQLGLWQKIFFFELDRARPRQAQIMIIGE